MKVLIREASHAKQMLSMVFNTIVPMLLCGKRVWIQVWEETRTLPQNAKFHALCGDLAKSALPWAGKKRSAVEWKVLLVSGHATATKEGSEMVPGLEGEFINLRESTALMSISRGASLIEYCLAFCAMNDVKLSDPEDWRNWGLSMTPVARNAPMVAHQ